MYSEKRTSSDLAHFRLVLAVMHNDVLTNENENENVYLVLLEILCIRLLNNLYIYIYIYIYITETIF